MLKRVYIFGASSAISSVIEGCAFSDFEVVRVSRSKLEPSDGMVDELVSDYSSDEILTILEKYQVADKTIVIFCNGVTDQGLFISQSDDAIRKVFDINVITPLSITNIFLKKYAFNEIRFIFLGSTRAALGDRGVVLYSSSKHAISAAVRSLSLEYSNFKKYFFVLSIGLTDFGLISEISKQKIGDLLSRGAIKKYVSERDICKSIEFLMENTSMTGSILLCDNGYH